MSYPQGYLPKQNLAPGVHFNDGTATEQMAEVKKSSYNVQSGGLPTNGLPAQYDAPLSNIQHNTSRRKKFIAFIVFGILVLALVLGLSIGISHAVKASHADDSHLDNIPKGAQLTGSDCRLTGQCARPATCDYESGLCYTLK